MKKLNLTLLTLLTIFSCTALFAETILFDNFTVTGSGDINFQYDAVGRQTGLDAPKLYNPVNGPSTVTDSGLYAGKCLMDGTPTDSWLSPGGNFNQSSDFSIEFELTRLFSTDKVCYFSFGKNGIHQAANSPDPGMGIIFFENGWYQVFQSNSLVFSQQVSALSVASNPSLEVKVVVSNSTFVTLFINGVQYPVNTAGPDTYIYEYNGGFDNNYVTFISQGTDVTIDDFNVEDNSVQKKILKRTTFADNFSVAGGGGVNFQYDVIGRQTGAEAPMVYSFVNGPSTVTNAGSNSGKCFMDGTPVDSWLSASENFKQSANFSIEFELTRLLPANKLFYFSFGKDEKFQAANSTTPGMGIIFFESGWYQVFDSSSTPVCNRHFPALEAASNPSLEIKIIVSNSTFVTMFINDIQYPLKDSGSDVYTYEYSGGFDNNYITFISSQTDVTIDNFEVLDTKEYKFNNDRFQFVKTSSEISGYVKFLEMLQWRLAR